MSSRCCRSRPTAMTSGVEALACCVNPQFRSRGKRVVTTAVWSYQCTPRARYTFACRAESKGKAKAKAMAPTKTSPAACAEKTLACY
jgi:hypothetical protein